jgi:hypothetical protein
LNPPLTLLKVPVAVPNETTGLFFFALSNGMMGNVTWPFDQSRWHLAGCLVEFVNHMSSSEDGGKGSQYL